MLFRHGFYHRFHKAPELVALLTCLAAAIRDHGTLGELFRVCYDDADADIGPSLTRFVEALIGKPSHLLDHLVDGGRPPATSRSVGVDSDAHRVSQLTPGGEAARHTGPRFQV